MPRRRQGHAGGYAGPRWWRAERKRTGISEHLLRQSPPTTARIRGTPLWPHCWLSTLATPKPIPPRPAPPQPHPPLQRPQRLLPNLIQRAEEARRSGGVAPPPQRQVGEHGQLGARAPAGPRGAPGCAAACDFQHFHLPQCTGDCMRRKKGHAPLPAQPTPASLAHAAPRVQCPTARAVQPSSPPPRPPAGAASGTLPPDSMPSSPGGGLQDSSWEAKAGKTGTVRLAWPGR